MTAAKKAASKRAKTRAQGRPIIVNAGAPTGVKLYADSAQSFLEHHVDQRANRHLALYVQERNGLGVWSAYLEYRMAGLLVQEVILSKLDQFAHRLLRSNSLEEIASALEMRRALGGSLSARDWKIAERNLAVVERVRFLMEHGVANGRVSRRKACAIVGREQGRTANAVEQALKRWRAPVGDRPVAGAFHELTHLGSTKVRAKPRLRTR